MLVGPAWETPQLAAMLEGPAWEAPQLAPVLLGPARETPKLAPVLVGPAVFNLAEWHVFPEESHSSWSIQCKTSQDSVALIVFQLRTFSMF